MTTSTLQAHDNKAVEHRVIHKLFRRLIVFLFILFVFSFLDRINIGFAGLTMGKDLGLTSTMFGPPRRSLRHLRAVRDPEQHHAGEDRRAPLDRRDHGGVGYCLHLHHVRHQPRNPLRSAHAGGHCRSRLPAGDSGLPHRWFPAYHRARANALFMIAMPVTMMLGSILSGYILAMDGLWNLKGWQWLFLLEGLPSVVLGVVTGFTSTTRRIRPRGWMRTKSGRSKR